MIIARAHLSQQKIVHPLGDFTYGMSIAGTQQVDSWGAVSQTSVYAIGVSEHWATNGSYVLRSIVILLYSGMSMQFGLIMISLISFLASILFKRSGNKSAKLACLFVFQPGCIASWGFVPTVFCSNE